MAISMSTQFFLFCSFISRSVCISMSHEIMMLSFPNTVWGSNYTPDKSNVIVLFTPTPLRLSLIYIQLNLKPRYSKFLSLGMPPSTLTILIFVSLEGDFFSQRNRYVPTISVCPREIGVSDISYCMIEQSILHRTLFLPLDFPETVLTKNKARA